MSDYLEKIAEDAFNDELAKIAKFELKPIKNANIPKAGSEVVIPKGSKTMTVTGKVE
jgi:hypothetical protein